jgi:hypothetical protein
MPAIIVSCDTINDGFMLLAYAIMFTLLPPAFSAMVSANLAARASIEPEAGTVAVITSIFFRASASRIPRQYWMPGRLWPAKCSSSNPRRPCARIIGFLGASAILISHYLSAQRLLVHFVYEGNVDELSSAYIK